MADKIYNADSRILRYNFRMTDSKIIVSRHIGKSEWSFDLADLAPTPERIRQRFARLVFFPILYVGTVALILWGIFKDRIVESEIALFYGMGGGLIISLLWLTYRWSAPVEFARFRTKGGELAFDIAKGDKQAISFESFVEELENRIKNQDSTPRPSHH